MWNQTEYYFAEVNTVGWFGLLLLVVNWFETISYEDNGQQLEYKFWLVNWHEQELGKNYLLI